MSFSERVKQARAQIQDLRKKSEQVVERIVLDAPAGIKELRQVGERLKPVLNSVVADGVAAVREWVDEANRRLADMAVPSYRKARVAQKRLEEKFQQLGGVVVEKVRSGRKVSEDETAQSSASVAEAKDPVTEPQNQQPRPRKVAKAAASAVTVKAANPGKGNGNGRPAKAKKTAQGRQKPRAQIKTAGKGVSKVAKVASNIS